ncbi:uncharacterized protein PHALS_05911 [Plasmopara halstedii]|uniref:Uncharacterized protein n=1 Tax=Plasmopara halstedii TaxID=4781 RepID=A0A0P1ABP1_PLAHL|nr:uncharacterized protein PHALS_05911 [Plasmopara halstedii]CEG37860.1 hypothetical protein PHALS_05911 [Plasmopara halstedii]|eukprot:XP_024574229.1 hypothetical protein PHALS_05911 [Plasmopara halstedii]
MKKKNKKCEAGNDEKQCLSDLFTFMQTKALLALREAQVDVIDEKNDRMVAGLAKNMEIDPWLVEELYQQVQDLLKSFQDLIEEMYTIQSKARDLVRDAKDDDDECIPSTKLRSIDYFQMINQELAMFEAEYQHIEALLRSLSFKMTSDELNTLVISWSTSPFLDPAQSRAFQQRHQISSRLHA